MVGKKSCEDDVLPILVECKTRDTISQKIDGKDPDSVDYALKQLIHQFGSLFGRVFRTITVTMGMIRKFIPRASRSRNIPGRSSAKWFEP
ncbi:MAG: hypothetical protein LKI80_04835 [Sporolactobacillus sp.]|jgi:IS30 family transposase|nr:hypothetical protein [Sporolactobacillus sp.]